jgi:hypothetical protein
VDVVVAAAAESSTEKSRNLPYPFRIL